MSWSTSVPGTSAEEFEAAVGKAEIPRYEGAIYQEPEMSEQLAAAKAAVLAIFRSGAVGREGYFAASLSGHTNAGHQKTPGWGSDTVYASVYQTDPPQESRTPVNSIP